MARERKIYDDGELALADRLLAHIAELLVKLKSSERDFHEGHNTNMEILARQYYDSVLLLKLQIFEGTAELSRIEEGIKLPEQFLRLLDRP